MTSAECTVTIEPGKVPVVVVVGEVNYESAPRIRQALSQLQLEGHLSLALDCSSVDFIDSSGIGAVVHAAETLRQAGGSLRLRGAAPQLVHALQVSGFAGLLDLQKLEESPLCRAAVERRAGAPGIQRQARFSVPLLTDEGGTVRKRVTEIAETMPFSREQIDDIRLAVGEAVANAVRHGRRNEHDCLTVHCTADSDKLVVRIHNPGKPFNPDAVPLPDPYHVREGGLGIFFMRASMDSVDYSFDKAGTTVTMVKYVCAASEGDDGRGDELDG